jgi:hypothetical protein
MHVKELDRQAAPKLHPPRARGSDASLVTVVVGAVMPTLLRRLHAVGNTWRMAKQI